MQVFFRLSSLALLLSLLCFSCVKEDQLKEVAADSTQTEVIDLGVGDRGVNVPVTFSWTAGNGVNVQYQLLDATTNQVLYSKTWSSSVSGSIVFQVPHWLCLKAVVKGKRNYEGGGTENLNWQWKTGACPQASGTYAITASLSTSWANIPWHTMVANQCPCN